MFPWVVRVGGGCTGGTVCGATIISPRLLASAFHCTINSKRSRQGKIFSFLALIEKARNCTILEKKDSLQKKYLPMRSGKCLVTTVMAGGTP